MLGIGKKPSSSSRGLGERGRSSITPPIAQSLPFALLNLAFALFTLTRKKYSSRFARAAPLVFQVCSSYARMRR